MELLAKLPLLTRIPRLVCNMFLFTLPHRALGNKDKNDLKAGVNVEIPA